MPSVPAIGEITICELNRTFRVSSETLVSHLPLLCLPFISARCHYSLLPQSITYCYLLLTPSFPLFCDPYQVTSSGDDDTEAQNAYSKILGRVYPFIPYVPYQSFVRVSRSLISEAEDENVRQVDSTVAKERRDSTEGRHVTEDRGFKAILVKQLTTFLRILPWFSTTHHFEVLKKVELFQGVCWHRQKPFLAFLSGAGQVIVYDFEKTDSKYHSVLSSGSQNGAVAIAWRPNAGMTLSVACRGGICVWTASYPGSIAPVRSGITSFLGIPTGSPGARWTLVDVLQNPGRHPITAVSWSPSGRLLASASWYDSGFMIWDAAQGIGTPLRRGFGAVSLLLWSTQGNYLFSATLDGAFYLWETNSWTSEKWSSSGGAVVSAMWSPDDTVLLIAFDQTTTLGALYFAAKPPSLDVQLLPVELPEIDSLTERHGQLEKVAWDGSGERLAVSFSGGDEIHAGLIAIYDTRKTPILAVSLLGFVRGPGSQVKPCAFAFHDVAKHGVLLSVVWRPELRADESFTKGYGGRWSSCQMIDGVIAIDQAEGWCMPVYSTCQLEDIYFTMSIAFGTSI